MTPREQTEELESAYMCEYAFFSKNTKGRRFQSEKCPVRTEFQRDRDRIIHSNSFRRLKHKTQVYLIPTGDHYRTRLTHTLEVAQIARTIARALRLNEDLTEAIALGHDLGHTPFGHAGEEKLNELSPDGFKHYVQSLRVVDYIESGGDGLNLTFEVRNGIVCHTNKIAKTREGYIVRLADKIAYINHDIDDSVRAEIIKQSDLPVYPVSVLGKTKSERITTVVSSIIKNGAETIKIDDEIQKAQDELHSWMFENVYKNPIAKSEESRAKLLIERLYEYFFNSPDELPAPYIKIMERYSKQRAVCDYIAGMTDGYAINLFKSLFVPKGWSK
ncbi:MAG: deoxyguanosinetriphosphate triphosphohydrolase [Oscillospiraceae bacterium]|jgi:dGTPase